MLLPRLIQAQPPGGNGRQKWLFSCNGFM